MCANTSIGQLLKVPNLINHYTEHKNELTTTSISFIDYIKLHYSKNVDNKDFNFEDLKIQYKDYAIWQQEKLKTQNSLHLATSRARAKPLDSYTAT